MANWKSAFNFPVVYNAVFKNNTASTQYDAFNILLVGCPHRTGSHIHTYDDSPASGFISGSRKIPKKLCLSYLYLPEEERKNRILSVGISNITYAVNALTGLLESHHIIMDAPTRDALLQLAYGNDPIAFISESVFEAVKRNNDGLVKLDPCTVDSIFSFRNYRPTGDKSSAWLFEKRMLRNNSRGDTSRNPKTNPNGGSQKRLETEEPIELIHVSSTSPSTTENTDRAADAGICINADGGDYYILDEYNDNDYFSTAPSEYIANFLFFITLSSFEKTLKGGERRKNYLLLVHDRYMGDNDLWSVPFNSYSLPSTSGVNRPKTVKMIREYFKNHLSEMDREIHATTNQLIFHLNILSGYSLEEGDSYIEYKNSPSQPDRKKCYYIKEFFLKDVDPSEAINLTDPENLHGYRYFPLSEWEETDGDIPWFEESGKQLKFPGGYIPENVAKNIFDQKRIRSHTIPVPNNSLFYTGSGFLFRIDIINYTAAYELSYTSRKEDLEYEIKDIFERVLLINGINRFIIQDDTLTAWAPCTRTPGLPNPVYSIAESIHHQLQRIPSLSEVDPGIFCFTVYGDDIQFGKKYGLQQKTPCFLGPAIDRLTSLACSVINGFTYENLTIDIQEAMGNDSTGIINKMRNLLSTDLYDPHYQRDIIFVSDEAINFDPDAEKHYQKVNFSSLPIKSSKRDYYMYYRV